MANTAIVTDSTACLPKELVEQYGIEVVPIEFVSEGRIYHDEVNITPTEFYQLLTRVKKLPTTSPTSPGTYLEVFDKLVKKTSDILVITVSAKFSTMFGTARIAAEAAREKLRNVTIEVLDCCTAAGAQGFVVLTAARAAALGKSLSQVIEAAKSTMSRVYLVAFIDTLYYLVKSGRVPLVAAWATSLLNIKPVFQILPLSGEASLLQRVRTKPRAIDCLLQGVKEKTNGNPVHAIIMHSNVLDEAEELKSRVKSEFDCVEIHIKDFTPAMGVHIGPGMLGIAFYVEDSDTLLSTS